MLRGTNYVPGIRIGLEIVKYNALNIKIRVLVITFCINTKFVQRSIL